MTNAYDNNNNNNNGSNNYLHFLSTRSFQLSLKHYHRIYCSLRRFNVEPLRTGHGVYMYMNHTSTRLIEFSFFSVILPLLDTKLLSLPAGFNLEKMCEQFSVIIVNDLVV